MSPEPSALASAVLMIQPAAFGYNPQTALTNTMQRKEAPGEGAAAAARKEAAGCARALSAAGVSVCQLEDTPEPLKPDAVFPNNWVSFHSDGTVVLYPMQADNRRLERRKDIIQAVCSQLAFPMRRIIDLTHHEAEDRFLEGTGSLVLDHTHKLAYASLSPRTHPFVVQEWAETLGYEPILFRAADRAGVPLYHTNVLMSIGERAIVLGTEAIAPEDRGRVRERLLASGRELIEIDQGQIERFAGNVLELRKAGGEGSRVFVMSTSAQRALQGAALERLTACTHQVLAVDIPTIERLGGGSARCMLAEVFAV